MIVLKLFQSKFNRKVAISLGILIMFVLFNSSLRKPKSLIEKSFESQLLLITPELLKREPANTISPEVYISLSRNSGQEFRVKSSSQNISREQILRLLQLISETKLLTKNRGDLSLRVRVNGQEFQSQFDSDSLKKSIQAQTLSKLLSIYSDKNEG